MLRSIKVMMDELRTEIVTKFESITSETVKKDVAVAVELLKKDLSQQRKLFLIWNVRPMNILDSCLCPGGCS